MAKVPVDSEDVNLPPNVIETPDSLYESDDSISEFERNLRELLPGLAGESEAATTKYSKGTRRSERPKKTIFLLQ